MRLSPKFQGQMVNSQFVVDEFQHDVREAYFEGLEGKRVEEIVQKPRKSKTLQQIRYVHGVIFHLISEETGIPMQVVKSILKEQFLTEYYEYEGKPIKYVKSLADLKSDEMAQFIDDCIIVAAKHWHIVIPSPEEVAY